MDYNGLTTDLVLTALHRHPYVWDRMVALWHTPLQQGDSLAPPWAGQDAQVPYLRQIAAGLLAAAGNQKRPVEARSADLAQAAEIIGFLTMLKEIDASLDGEKAKVFYVEDGVVDVNIGAYSILLDYSDLDDSLQIRVYPLIEDADEPIAVFNVDG